MDRLPTLRLLTIFDAVHRLGSMQLAAAELNVTRPAVSQAIRALEEQVGVVLMDRSVKPSVPTEAGERLAQATRSGLRQIGDMIEEIRFSAGVAGRQVTVVEAEVFAERDGRRRLFSKATVTMAVVALAE